MPHEAHRVASFRYRGPLSRQILALSMQLPSRLEKHHHDLRKAIRSHALAHNLLDHFQNVYNGTAATAAHILGKSNARASHLSLSGVSS